MLSKSYLEQFTEEIKEKPYSLVCDETTDGSATRVLCILALFFNERLGKVDVVNVGMASVPQATGEALFNSSKEALKGVDMDLKNCISFGSNGASNVVEHTVLFIIQGPPHRISCFEAST